MIAHKLERPQKLSIALVYMRVLLGLKFAYDVWGDIDGISTEELQEGGF